ncbi:unnamed protein product [Urochloa humidicola]
MNGSTFNALKSLVPVAWFPWLYITTVRRRLPRMRHLHHRTLEAMRLRRCHANASRDAHAVQAPRHHRDRGDVQRVEVGGGGAARAQATASHLPPPTTAVAVEGQRVPLRSTIW